MMNDRISLGEEANRRQWERLTEAAERYGVHPRTIRRYIATGRITGHRFGPRLIMVDPDEVDRELNRQIPTAG
jgi:excisionase family DNA binding protein